MADKPVLVACPNGHTRTTAVRARGLPCRECPATIYVRRDGTTRNPLPAPPGSADRDGSGGARLDPAESGKHEKRGRGVYEGIYPD